jgi:uncharacterized protein DUF7014/AbiJ-like protein
VPIFDTFTKRTRRAVEAGKQKDLYRYDDLPPTLRTQIVYILLATLGRYREIGRYDFSEPPRANGRWALIRDTIARERGVFSLTGKPENPFEQCANAILSGRTDLALDVIDFAFKVINHSVRTLSDYHREIEGLTQHPDDAVEELNHRFAEHGFGYRFEAGKLLRIDSEFMHAEVTRPALQLLQDEGFQGALEEFMSAHDHYRKGEAKDANVDALNALESTLKTICDKRRWKYSKGANGAELIKLVVRHGLIPAELQGHFSHLLKAMETGLPPVRHNFGGHGQGAEPKTVQQHLATYSLHLMAANIVLLIEAHRALR